MTEYATLEKIDVLLVEDNPADVKLTKLAFEEAKIINNLYVTTDGADALDFLKKRGKYADAPRPDLILLDLNLPKMDGRELLREIKIVNGLSTIPVVILTSSSAEQDIIKTYKLHANCYITKPVDFEQFLKIIRAIENFWIGVVKLPPK